ncbi:17510_t:CDS:2, partial [Funneliformis geosporum]
AVEVKYDNLIISDPEVWQEREHIGDICWTRRTFRELLLTADENFKKLGKSNGKRSELMQQMKLFRKRQIPFDIELEKTSDEICEILVDAHLNLDEDLIEIMEEDNGINDAEINSFGKEADLIISRFLNKDVDTFVNDLDEIIEDSLEEDSEKEDNQNVVEKEKETNIEWDPIAAADDIVNNL